MAAAADTRNASATAGSRLKRAFESITDRSHLKRIHFKRKQYSSRPLLSFSSK
jgi:hypothetical protein